MFVKPEHENRMSHVNTASVKTGLGNTLGRQSLSSASQIQTKRIQKIYNSQSEMSMKDEEE